MVPLIPFSASYQWSNLVTPLGTTSIISIPFYTSSYPPTLFDNRGREDSFSLVSLLLTDGVEKGLKGDPHWVETRFAAGALPHNHGSHNMSAHFFGELDSWQRCRFVHRTEKIVVNVNQGLLYVVRIVVRLLQFLHLLTFYRAVSGKGGGKRIVTLHNVMHTYESRFVALLLPASSFLNYYRGS